jgi:hypothetical protein
LAIDDKLEKLVEGLRVEVNPSPQLVALDALIASIPYVGAAIGSILIDKWKQRLIKRAVTLFREIKNRMEKLEETALDHAYFDTEEFQTILFLALQQLQTTHDKQKIRMLAWAVANSGTRDYSSDTRKEIFVRALRELTPHHIEMLKRLRPAIHHGDQTFYTRETLKRLGDFDLLVAHDLVRLGFVRESLEFARLQHRHTGTRPEELAAKTEELARAVLDETPARLFDITNLGLDFMKFVGEPAS